MANNILYALAAALLMVGCAKVEPDFGNKQAEDLDITFQVGNYAAATKADAEPEYKALDEKVAFGTFCTFTPGAFADGNGTPYMQNVKISKQGTGTDAWRSDVSYYWPKAGKLSFVSYAPYKEGAYKANPSAGDTDFYVSLVEDHANEKYNIRFNNYTVDGSEDLMYSEQRLDLNANAENTYKNGFNGVPTLFHHALTWVEFNFTTIDSKADKCWIEIESATVDNCINKGSFDSSTEKWSAASEDARATTTSVRGDNAVVYFMPQNLSSVKLTVKGVIKNRVLCADGTTTEDFKTPFERTVTLGGSWAINTHVVYNVDVPVGEKLIKFGVTTTNWVNIDSNITLQ